jgi:hypothetical protein
VEGDESLQLVLQRPDRLRQGFDLNLGPGVGPGVDVGAGVAGDAGGAQSCIPIPVGVGVVAGRDIPGLYPCDYPKEAMRSHVRRLYLQSSCGWLS